MAIEQIIGVLQGQDAAAKTALVSQLMGTPVCIDGGCSWVSGGGDADDIARNNAPTQAKLVAYFKAKRDYVR